ncbi:MAG: histidinol-phosphate transaminase [Burkholderia sp.]|nr:histidinol-phosphate transaminase [Burkholderia sp.]
MTTPQDIIRQDILKIDGYSVQDATGFVKLDAMENPYSISIPIMHALGERLSQVILNRYPISRPSTLINKIRDIMKVPEPCDVLLGNGSDEIISMLSVACAKPKAKILAPVPGFIMVEMSARFSHLEFVGVPLLDDMSLDIDAMLIAIDKNQPALIYLAYPNNPTGTLFSDAEIEEIIALSKGGLIIIDEAYHPFAQQSWLQRIVEFDNVVIMRTVSKLGLAGIRLGYLVGMPIWITEIDKVRPPYNINALTQEAANFFLDYIDIFNAQAADLCYERERLAIELSMLPGVRVFPSSGNFLLVRVPSAAIVFDALMTEHILIKNVSKIHPLLSGCLRLTIGSPEENASLLSAMRIAVRLCM